MPFTCVFRFLSFGYRTGLGLSAGHRRIRIVDAYRPLVGPDAITVVVVYPMLLASVGVCNTIEPF